MPGPGSIGSASLLSNHSRDPPRNNPYNRGPLFAIDTFASSDFIVKDFVENLAETAVPSSRRSLPPPGAAGAATGQAFDPKPLIRTFEQALTRLKTLSEDLEIRENELSANVRRVEHQHKQSVRARAGELERAVKAFNKLERSLTSEQEVGSNAAVRIGERLEELDKQGRRAQDAKFILQCWLEVSGKGDLSCLEEHKRQRGVVHCAHIARQLLRICHRLEPQTNGAATNGNRRASQNDQPKESIEKFLEALEKDLLRQFDDFYRRQNFEGMRECALALKDFSDGTSVVTLFVNQHQFFIDRSQLVTEDVSGHTDMWERLADPDAESPGVEPSLQSLIDEVKLTVQEESFIIKRAFPYYEEVLTKFLQRVFQQSIQQKLELVLNKASTVSSLALLRSLQAAKGALSSLVEDLKAHGLTEHPEPASAHIVSTLDSQLDELFIPWSTSSHIEREKRSLADLYSSLLYQFTLYHVRH